MGHLVLPFPVVKKAMESRRQSRRFRRYRKTPQRPIRFRHRTDHKIPPSIKANRELEWRVLHELASRMSCMKSSKRGARNPLARSWSTNSGR